jgi:spermidine/putrescine transport system substrate-binding protein
MFDLGYLERLNHADLKTVFNNISPALRNDPADPGRQFSIPWQGGLTGIWVITSGPGNQIRSMKDLFDPRYKGKVSLLTEMRDTVPMTLKSMGIDPAQASKDQWLEAVDKVAEAADSGQVREFTGNEYIKSLPKGDTWIALGWSGDAIQLQKDNPDIRFVMPKEGCMLWSTSMEIPVGAPNPQAAQAFIDFVYDPQVQADIAEWVNYVTPVKGVKEILRKRDPALAKSELIFPSEDYTANCSFEPVLGGALGQEVTEAFQQAIGA